MQLVIAVLLMISTLSRMQLVRIRRTTLKRRPFGDEGHWSLSAVAHAAPEIEDAHAA